MQLILPASGFECDPEVRSIIVPVEQPAVPPSVAYDIVHTDGFAPKQEGHITVLPRRVGAALSAEDFGRLTALARDTAVPDVSAEACLYRIASDKEEDGVLYHRQSLVMVCSSVAIRAFVRRARAAGVDMPQPFIHLTMYTKGDEGLRFKGIGVATQQDWDAFSPILYAVWGA